MTYRRIHELLTEIGQCIEETRAQAALSIEATRAQAALSDAALEHLRAIYMTAFIEGSYDPYNERSYEAAVKIWPHIKALNDELKFRT